MQSIYVRAKARYRSYFSEEMEKYVIEKVIGEGTYGVVYKAKEKVGQAVDVAQNETWSWR